MCAENGNRSARPRQVCILPCRGLFASLLLGMLAVGVAPATAQESPAGGGPGGPERSERTAPVLQLAALQLESGSPTTPATDTVTNGAAPTSDPDETITRWATIKRAANDALVAAGATLSHHHGVGQWHAPWLAAEIGASGQALLAAAARHLDPDGILNPNVLLAPEDRLEA